MDSYTIEIKKDINFDYEYSINLSKNITWGVGTGSEYWWEVKGCCKEIYNTDQSENDVCPPIKINENCENKAQSIQTLLSPTIEDLCQELKQNNWDWRICSIKRWSRPAENEFVTSSDECNILESIDYRNIPECISLSTDQTIYQKIKFKNRIFFSKCILENCIGNIFSYQGSGNIKINSAAELVSDEQLKISSEDLPVPTSVREDIRFKVTSIIKELKFSENYTNQYIPTLNLVQVSCENCNELPNIFYVDNNLQNLNIFSQFLYKNDYEIEDEISIQYNKTNNLWSTIKKFESKYNKESWRILIDFGCKNETNSDFYYWKFTLLVTHNSDEIKKESKISLSVPSKFICEYSKSSIIDFKYNINTKYVFINYRAYYNDFYFKDDIGLFKSNYWEDNPEIIIKVTKDKIKNRINKKTIYY